MWRKQAAANPDFLLTREAVVEEWEAKHGRIPSHAWVLIRTDWSKHGTEQEIPQCRAGRIAHPGFRSASACRSSRKERDILGVGVETVGTDAGQAHSFDPMFPCHTIMHGSNKFGLASLTNLDQLPADGRGGDRAAAEDRQWLRQPAARAGAGSRLAASALMAERSFAKEVQSLRLGEGEEFRGEGILAVTKALLQSGVAYVGGYQGAPISHLMDVLADAEEILNELGVHFEASASEATAAAMLAASINYPMRGAVTWKSTVGTNVASDALANLASAGVKGGALIVVGEDYGEGASIMQERTHAFAMKSQMWLLDPTAASARHRARGRAGLRAVRGQQHPGDADAAHPRVSRVRSLHDARTTAARRSRRPTRWRHPSRDYGTHHPAAVHLCAGEGEDREALAGRAALRRRARAE